MPVRYIFDTNVYIECMLTREFALQHTERYGNHLPFTFFSSVVAQELLVGCTDELAIRRVQNFLSPFERVGRVVNPTYQDWKDAAHTVVKIGLRRRDLKSKKVALVNDVMIALSCRRIGATLVTLNSQDFETIRRFIPFQFTGF